MINQNLGQPVKNKYKVPKSMWDSWSNHAKSVFNSMYHELRTSRQGSYLPANYPMSAAAWGAMRWVIAEAAANVVNSKGGKPNKVARHGK